jgi:hypothetical protein
MCVPWVMSAWQMGLQALPSSGVYLRVMKRVPGTDAFQGPVRFCDAAESVCIGSSGPHLTFSLLPLCHVWCTVSFCLSTI